MKLAQGKKTNGQEGGKGKRPARGKERAEGQDQETETTTGPREKGLRAKGRRVG